MIFLEIFVGAAMAVILMFVGHTLGEAKADKDIITKFNKVEAQLRAEIRKELLNTERLNNGLTNYVFSDIYDANNVLESLNDTIDSYGYAMVAHYKDLIGEETKWSDWGIGWYSTDDMKVREVAKGYMLELPNPEKIPAKTKEEE